MSPHGDTVDKVDGGDGGRLFPLMAAFRGSSIILYLSPVCMFRDLVIKFVVGDRCWYRDTLLSLIFAGGRVVQEIFICGTIRHIL